MLGAEKNQMRQRRAFVQSINQIWRTQTLFPPGRTHARLFRRLSWLGFHSPEL
jgi:hypothetical protein